jgi:hypothetical protein
MTSIFAWPSSDISWMHKLWCPALELHWGQAYSQLNAAKEYTSKMYTYGFYMKKCIAFIE